MAVRPRATLKVIGDEEGYEEIRVDQEPVTSKWKFTPLYKVDANGNMREWQVSFDGVETLTMTHGVVGGKPVSSTHVVVPKANRTMQQQALQEARYRYTLTYRNDGYRPAGVPPSEDIGPMLANKFVTHKKYAEATAKFNAAMEREGNPKGSERTKLKNAYFDVKWRLIERWPVAVQAKLDGFRIMCKEQGDQIYCRKPRTNNPYNNTQHIEDAIRPFFAYLPAGTILDGEIWHRDWTFNQLSSVVQTRTRIHPDMHKTTMYIFDIITPEPMPFEDRYAILLNAYKRFIEDHPEKKDPGAFTLVSIDMANNDDEVQSFHDQYVQAGFEGLMVRRVAGPAGTRTQATINEALYESKYSNNLLKFKAFDDEEGLVIGVEEGSGTEAGLALIKIRDRLGHEFVVRPRGSFEQRAVWFRNPNLVLGKQFTFRFQGRSEEYGVPRFPTGVGVRQGD